MRTLLIGLGLAVSVVGCKWTDFDDLEKETWVRSLDDSDVGSTDYAIAIGGITEGSSGGKLAVISDDTASYATITYNSAGTPSLDPNPIRLGTQKIGALPENPAFAVDAMGQIGLVTRSINGGNFAVLFGSPTAPAGLELMSAETPTPEPDAAIFVGGDLLFAAGNAFYTVPASGGTPIVCAAKDAANMPLQVAGMAADATNLWVWTKGGVLLSYPLAALNPCMSGMAPAPGASTFTAASFMPATAAHVILQGNHAILAGHATTSRSGQVLVVDLTNMTQIGSTLTVEGLTSAILADFGTGTYLAVGIPDQQVNKVASGVAELFEYAPDSGMLGASPVETLHDSEPESGQQFGRSLTTMSFNGNPILVVGAGSEVFAYFRTALYDHLP